MSTIHKNNNKDLRFSLRTVLIIPVLLLLLGTGCGTLDQSPPQPSQPSQTDIEKPDVPDIHDEADEKSLEPETPFDLEIEGVLVVNYLQNNTEDHSANWISRSVTDFLISELSGFDFIQVVSRENLASVFEEQKLSLSGATEEVMDTGRILNADYILSGDYYKHNGRLTVNVQLIDAVTSETKWASQISGTPENIYGIQERVLYQFLDYNNVQLKSEELAVRDYETDGESIRNFFRAEELIEENQDEEARELLERLLQENRLFTPAREKLASLDGEIEVDGKAVVEAIDAQLRQKIRYKNLTSSFIAYTESRAFKVLVGEPEFHSDDGELYELRVDVEVVLRDEYLDLLYDFVESHDYIADTGLPPRASSRDQLLEHISLAQQGRYMAAMGSDRYPKWFLPQESRKQFWIKFSEDMFGDQNYYGSVRLSLRDSDGNAYWNFFSTSTQYPYSAERGELPYHPRTSGSVYRFESLGTFNYFAFLGGRHHNSFERNNSIILGQDRFRLNTRLLTRDDVINLAEITAEPYFVIR